MLKLWHIIVLGIAIAAGLIAGRVVGGSLIKSSAVAGGVAIVVGVGAVVVARLTGRW